MKRHAQLAADLLPALDLIEAQPDPLAQLLAVELGEQIQHVRRSAQHPGCHRVRVRVGVETAVRRVGAGIRRVVLVGSHHTLDLVASDRAVIRGGARPEPSDLEHHLGPVHVEELVIVGRLVVLPDVVGDGGVDVALPEAVVGDPVPRVGIEVQPLALLPPVAAALPRKHGAQVAGLPCGTPSLRQSAVPVPQQRLREHRHAQRQEGKDEEFVPEDVSAIGLAVPAPRGHASVEVDGVDRHGLQQVKDVDANPQLRLDGVAVVERDVTVVPQVFPRKCVRRPHVVEAPGVGKRPLRFEPRLRNGLVARRVAPPSSLRRSVLPPAPRL